MQPLTSDSQPPTVPILPADVNPLAPVIVMITAESHEQARAISRDLLERRLAACATLIRGVESLYWWKGVLESAVETLIIVKTVAGNGGSIRTAVRAIHTYEVFEMVVVPIVGGSEDYLDWIAREVLAEGGSGPRED